MDRERLDDDPTRALDGFLQRQPRPADDTAVAPDLGDLLAMLHPERIPAARPRGGVLKDGTVWTGDDVVDVPVVERPVNMAPPPGPPTLDLPTVDPGADAESAAQMPSIELPTVAMPDPEVSRALAESTGQATALAAAQWLAQARTAAPPVLRADWQRQPAPNPRVLANWQTGAWIAARRLAVPATTELVGGGHGPLIETYPPEHLVVLWSPARTDTPHLGRWPRQAYLSDAPAEQLDAEVLDQVPDDTPLWWLPAQSDLVDWALVADIVLIHESTLRPFQIQALKALAEQEREAAFTRVNNAYHRPATGEPVQHKP